MLARTWWRAAALLVELWAPSIDAAVLPGPPELQVVGRDLADASVYGSNRAAVLLPPHLADDRSVVRGPVDGGVVEDAADHHRIKVAQRGPVALGLPFQGEGHLLTVDGAGP